MLCVIGDLVEDVVVWLPTTLSYGTDTPSKIVRTRGGSASNVAVFAATRGRARDGNSASATTKRVRLIAQVGNDALGDQLVEALRVAGVDPCVVRSGRTGSIVVIVSLNGERTMLTDRAASTELREPQENWSDGVSVLHVPAYSLFLEPLSTAARSCIVTAHAQNITVSIDASSTSLIESFGVQKFRELVIELRPKIFFCNTDEAEVLNLTANPLDLDIVVIKGGSQPTTLIRNGKTTTIDVAPVAKIIDSTGAGDAFAAGFLTRFEEIHICESSRDRPAEELLRDCVLAGHQLASQVLCSPGATIGTR